MLNLLGNPVSCQQRDQLHSPEYMKQSETNHTINLRSFIHVKVLRANKLVQNTNVLTYHLLPNMAILFFFLPNIGSVQ